jgi:MFS transporter, PAT family, beta-lactamase induction signal transducer AmpG
MEAQRYAKPFYLFFLMLPTGISNGFLTVVLPYLLTQNGFPVALTATIVALGLSANLWRFLWGPVVDLSFGLKSWYWIGLIATVTTLLVLTFTPFTIEGKVLLSTIVFTASVASTLILLPINGVMANGIEERHKGAASGWYQAGSLAGTGFGGGVGLWLATHYGVAIAGMTLCAASVLFGLVILLIKDVQYQKESSILVALKGIGKDLIEMVKSPVVLYAAFLVIMPIGSGAAANLWSAIAQDWQTSGDTVALVTGILSGLVSALGCVAGGSLSDRWGVWNSYLGIGAICAGVVFGIAFLPMVPSVYVFGVLAYAFTTGMVYASFTFVVLHAIGKKNVATKFSIFGSIGNLSVVYMTAINGWVHDKYSSKSMLITEGVLEILAVILFALILRYLLRSQRITI